MTATQVQAPAPPEKKSTEKPAAPRWRRALRSTRRITKLVLLILVVAGIPYGVELAIPRIAAAVVRQQLGLTTKELYTLGYLFTGFYLDRFGLEHPVKVEVPGITDQHVERFTKHFASELNALRTRIKEQQSYDQDFAYVMNPLMSTPLVWVTLRGKRTLIAPIPTYVIRRFTEGVYYEICNVDGFSAAFGNSFQQYVGEALTAATTGTSISILGEQPYRVGKELKASVDWIATDATGTLFVECKAKKVRFAAKIALADAAILDEDLGKMAGFVVQVYKTLADAKAGLYPHWKPNDRSIYPIIVTLEDWFVFGDRICSAVNERVKAGMEAAQLDPAMLDQHPFSICSVEDLEHAAQIMAQRDIDTVIGRKVDGERRLWTLGSVLRTDFPVELKKVRKLFPEVEKEIGVKP